MPVVLWCITLFIAMCIFLLESKWSFTRCLLKIVHNQLSAWTQSTDIQTHALSHHFRKDTRQSTGYETEQPKMKDLWLLSSSPPVSALFSPSPKHKLLMLQPSSWTAQNTISFTTARSIYNHIYKGFSEEKLNWELNYPFLPSESHTDV